MGKHPRSRVKQLPLLLSNGDRAREIRALLHGKRQNYSSSQSFLHGATAALKGKPFNTKSLSPVLCPFYANITEPKGVGSSLAPCPRYVFLRAESLGTEKR